jgi:hypothetical protein
MQSSDLALVFVSVTYPTGSSAHLKKKLFLELTDESFYYFLSAYGTAFVLKLMIEFKIK